MSEETQARRDKLRATLEGHTPGPWRWDTVGFLHDDPPLRVVFFTGQNLYCEEENRALVLTAADPQDGLIAAWDEIAELRRKLEIAEWYAMNTHSALCYAIGQLISDGNRFDIEGFTGWADAARKAVTAADAALDAQCPLKHLDAPVGEPENKL